MKKRKFISIHLILVMCFLIVFSSCYVWEEPTTTTKEETSISHYEESIIESTEESLTDAPSEPSSELDTNEKIVNFYKQAYINTLKNGGLSGTDYIEIVPQSFKVNGLRNELANSIVTMIFTQLTENKNRIMALPPQGDEFFGTKDVETATVKDNGSNLTLNISITNADIVAKERDGESSFFTMALEQVKESFIKNGVTWPEGKDLYDCLRIICSANGKIVVNKQKNMIVQADYSMLVSLKMREISYKFIFNNTSIDGEIKYEMHFPKSV